MTLASIYPSVQGIEIPVFLAGKAGRPILYLHGLFGHQGATEFLTELGQLGVVHAPVHPGFDNSPLPKWMTNVEDLAYFYLDYLRDNDLQDALVIGASLGGWIAAQMSVMDTSRIGALALINTVGIRTKERDQADLADIFTMPDSLILEALYCDTERFAPNFANMDDTKLEEYARNREAVALYGWKPYLHDPKLGGRLRRINVPTAVFWGEKDGIAPTEYGKKVAELIPNADFVEIANAAHCPEIEQPKETIGAISRFMENL